MVQQRMEMTSRPGDARGERKKQDWESLLSSEMAELLLCLTNANISLGQAMDAEKTPGVGKDFESVELGDMNVGQSKVPVKVPRRTIYFASGETMEEYSTDEEEEEEPAKTNHMAATDTSKLTWGPYFWFHMWRAATSTISVCDYLGEKMASLFGISSPKYQYAIDEYYRMKQEEEEEEEENRLSEEAEHRFKEQQNPMGPITCQGTVGGDSVIHQSHL